MVRFLIVILSLFIFGCDSYDKQIIKKDKFTFDVIEFDTVSKELFYDVAVSDSDQISMNEIIQYWFDNRIKTNGFEGRLYVIVKDIDFVREKKNDYYKLTISLSFEFIEENLLDEKITYHIKVKEYGEIIGNFSIKDQDNLDVNIMHQSLKSLSNKLNDRF